MEPIFAMKEKIAKTEHFRAKTEPINTENFLINVQR